MGGWGWVFSRMPVPVEPTFEFIEKDDVGVVVRKDVAPAVQGALGSKFAALGLYPADNPVCVFWVARSEYVKGVLRVCAYNCMYLPSHFLVRSWVVLAYARAHLVVPTIDEGVIGGVATHGARAVRVGEGGEKGLVRAKGGRGEERTGEVQGSHRLVGGDGRWEGGGVLGREGDEGRGGFLVRGLAEESGGMRAGAGDDEEEG